LHDSSGNLENKFILTTIPIPTFCFSPFYSTHDSINIEPAELYYSGKVAGEGKLIVISQPEGGDICIVYELDGRHTESSMRWRFHWLDDF